MSELLEWSASGRALAGEPESGDGYLVEHRGAQALVAEAVKRFAPVEETARALRDGWARPQDDALAVVVRWLGLRA